MKTTVVTQSISQSHETCTDSLSVPRAAYVHVPFCVHRCGYCDFTVIARRDDLIPEFLCSLEKELAQTLLEPHEVETLFIGGGTPSYLPADDLKRLMQLLQQWLPLTAGGEFSIECNPDGFTPDRMDVMASAGVNRISLGVQSFDPVVLKTLERQHTPDTVGRVVEQLRERELTNLSIDLIYGVPGQSLKSWEATLQSAVDLQPKHISTYGLTYEKGTSFWTRREKTILVPTSEDVEYSMYDAAMTLLPQAGDQQYELSNFAQPGWECRHNRVYWSGGEYYGFGPGAASYRDGLRATNHRSVTTWIKRLKEGRSPIQSSETLTQELRAREAVMLGLRETSGIDRQLFRHRFGCDIRELSPSAYDQFIEKQLLCETDTHVKLSRAGRFVADLVVVEFL